jgi:hypothetical protein
MTRGENAEGEKQIGWALSAVTFRHLRQSRAVLRFVELAISNQVSFDSNKLEISHLCARQ